MPAFPGVRIFVSGGLDEYDIDDLVRAGAAIDAFGVGTRMGVSADAPFVDSVYKLVEYAGRPVLKLSADKATAPGAKQVFRTVRGGRLAGDVIGLRGEPPPSGTEPLLTQAMTGGARLGPPGRSDLGDFDALLRTTRFAAQVAARTCEQAGAEYPYALRLDDEWCMAAAVDRSSRTAH